jgi:quercetin dioxygenase-like cupin family protein
VIDMSLEGSLTSTELERFAYDLTMQSWRWRHLVRHDDDARVHAQIWDDEQVNAWLICWSTDQDTGYHDHDVSFAAIAVISGRVREDRLRLAGPAATRVARAGQIFTIPAEAIHRVMHTGRSPAVTIHAYSPPLKQMGTYRRGPDGTLQRRSTSTQHDLREPALG